LNARRLSQAISEGDGISVIAAVAGADAARAAEDAGAEALVAHGDHALAEIRAATELPLLVYLRDDRASAPEGVDACIVEVRDDDRERLDRLRRDLGGRFELAPRICTDEHLAFVLEELDPEVLVLGSDDDDSLAGALELLPDVPAGKLAIADVGARTREEVVELERAGMDGVIVAAGEIAHLVGSAPPEV